MIIYKMPVPLDDHLQPHPRKGKRNEKCIFETLYNEIKCVLSINESNFKEKMEQVIKVKFGLTGKIGTLGPFQDFGPSWDQDPN